MYSLGKSSNTNLSTTSKYIQMIVRRAIKKSKSDFGILKTGGKRDAKMQNSIFLAGHSECDGYIKISNHQRVDNDGFGKAVDLVPYIDRKYTWSNKQAFIDIYEAWIEAEKELREEGLIPDDIFFHHGIFWNWKDLDMDGILELTDKLGWDSAHHEMRSKPQKI